MAELEVRNLCKRFGGTDAVQELTLSVKTGAFLVLVGPSGCGKTTTLRMIAGLETATSGDILLDGKRINALPPKDRDMAMVFQDYALYPHMSVRDNMAFGLRMRGAPKAERYRQVEQVAEMLGLGELLDRRPAALSGGERQRVALGRAIVRRPRIFLFDEPLSNLDAALRVQMRADLKRLHSELGTTFLYVTHDQIEAMTMATQIAVMDRGVLQQLGTPDEIYNRPANTFVAGFVGTPRMNLLDCCFTVQDGQMLCLIGSAQLPVPEAFKARLLENRLTGRRAILGVRPEQLHFAADGWRMQVAYTENIGSQRYVYLTERNIPDRMVMVTDAGQSPAGEICVTFDWIHALVFDAETRQRLF